MTSRLRNFSVVIFILAIVLSACGNQSPPSLTTAAAPTTLTNVVPESLMTVEGQAEDIIDSVPNAAWSQVNADISTIEQAWITYQPQAAKDGATQALQDSFTEGLARLKSAAGSQEASGTMQAANDLSAVVVDLFDLYHPAIPTDIGRLDVLERQLILDIANQNPTAVADTLAKLNQVWDRVRPSIVAHEGQAVAEQFEKSLTAQAAALNAQDTAAVIAEIQAGLEIVDALERLY